MKSIALILGYEPTLYLDDGHDIYTAGKRSGNIPGTGVVLENTFNRPVVNLIEQKAKEIGFRVFQSAPELTYVSLDERSDRINADFLKQRKLYVHIPWYKVAAGVSVHFNAFNGIFDGKAGGIEVFYHSTSAYGKILAQDILDHLLFGYTQVNRGIKNNSLHMTRETEPVFALAECGFMDKLEEAQKMTDPDFQNECAEEILAGLCEFYGQDLAVLRQDDSKTSIMGTTKITALQAQEWARSKGATEEFIGLAPMFWLIADKAGVDPAGAYAQSAKETGYGKFGGVIDATYKNPCGMKTHDGGGNYDPEVHQRFSTWEEGVTAQVDHLALYAGAPGYPLTTTPDPRHFGFILGTAKTFEDLGGKWAGSATYGTSIVAMVKDMSEVVVPEEPVSTYTDEEVLALEVQTAAMTARALKAEEKLSKINLIIES
jgi:N-acetylmuramoyl-L-alanine amidase